MIIQLLDSEIEVQSEKIVCPSCKGEGTHLHPAFHNQAVEPELLQDEEFMDMYFSGGMDVQCTHCKGLRVIDSPIIPEEYQEEYKEALRQEALFRMEQEAERRMGA